MNETSLNKKKRERMTVNALWMVVREQGTDEPTSASASEQHLSVAIHLLDNFDSSVNLLKVLLERLHITRVLMRK